MLERGSLVEQRDLADQIHDLRDRLHVAIGKLADPARELHAVLVDYLRALEDEHPALASDDADLLRRVTSSLSRAVVASAIGAGAPDDEHRVLGRAESTVAEMLDRLAELAQLPRAVMDGADYIDTAIGSDPSALDSEARAVLGEDWIQPTREEVAEAMGIGDEALKKRRARR